MSSAHNFGKCPHALSTKARFQLTDLSSTSVPISTELSTSGHCTGTCHADRPFAVNLHGPKNASGLEMQAKATKIANGAMVTIQLISWAGIIIVMGLILTVVGTSITECLANPR